MKVVSGDVFAIDVGATQVAVGQVVRATPPSRQVWVAIFWPPTNTNETDERVHELISTEPVLLAQTLDVFLKNGRWRRLSTADVTAPIPWPIFKEASAPGVFHIVDSHGARRRLASEAEISALPYQSTVSPAGVEMAVAALAGLTAWLEAFNGMRPSPNTEARFLGSG